MSAPFVSGLRSRPGTIRLGADGAPALMLRVQMPEVSDTVRIEAPASEPVSSLKVAALAALEPDAAFHEDYILKLNGFEVLDENASLGDAGAMDGSIFLVTSRRRRPVR